VNEAASPEKVARSLLLIEDNAADAEYVTSLLADASCSVRSVATLGAAERALGEQRFDVVILDLGLPELGPLEVVHRALAMVGGVPVVALTQFGDSLAYDCLNAGLQDFLPKAGLTRPLLLRAVEHAIVRARSAEILRRLDLAERQATLGSIASYVAHEINNQTSLLVSILELVRENLDALSEGSGDAAPIREAVSSLDEGRRTLERIGSIVRQLQILGERKEAKPARTDVAALVERTVATMGNRLRQSAMVSLDVEPCSPAAIAEQRLAQVLVNLLRNAAEAIEGDPATQRITVRLRETSEQVLLAVSDTGPGIRPADRENIFRPFFSTKPDGTGVGLAISAEIVAAAFGTLTVTSEPGSGATFTVALPRARAAMRGEPVGSLRKIEGMRLRVLMVDDDPRVRSALGALVRRHHDVVEAASGAEALEILDRGPPFDAVLCDLMMPGMDGTAVYEAIVRNHPQMAERFALLTGGAFTPATKRFVDSGDVAVLAKPRGYREVLAAIEDLAARAPAQRPREAAHR
jgi:signal transduction histidine kinase